MRIKINLNEAAAVVVGMLILMALCGGMIWQVTP